MSDQYKNITVNEEMILDNLLSFIWYPANVLPKLKDITDNRQILVHYKNHRPLYKGWLEISSKGEYRFATGSGEFFTKESIHRYMIVEPPAEE